MGQITAPGNNQYKSSQTINNSNLLSAYTHIFADFDYNRTPLSPPGTIIVIHNRPNDISSWAPHGEDDWYIVPSMEHYICQKAYTLKK